MKKTAYAICAAIGGVALTACTVHQADTPPVAGPSGLATAVTLTATPDTIVQDGASQSSITITAIGPDGKPRSGLALRLGTSVNGVAQDFGTLAARTVVTGSDGRATTVFTSPPQSLLTAGTVQKVSITATAIGTDALTSPVFGTPSVDIRLMPQGVILPPAGTPTAQFNVSPSPVNTGVPTIFDASPSTAGTNATSLTYSWSFGDGTASATGQIATHTFTAPGTYNVTLTVTNDRGLSASVVTPVQVSASPAPTGDWVYSPNAPNVGETVFFNADPIKPASGRTIVQYSWNFGDGTTASGFQTTHAFTAPATYTVTLSVRDDLDQKLVVAKQITIGTGNPTAAFTSSVTNAGTHTVSFDGSGSSARGGATIVSYQWSFGDGTTTGASSTPTTSHSYAAAGTFNVTLTVTDSLGRIGRTTSSVTVP